MQIGSNQTALGAVYGKKKRNKKKKNKEARLTQAEMHHMNVDEWC